MLHRSPRFNVTSVVWRPGDRAGAHNHETWGVIGVVDNEIEETRYRVTETGAGRAHLETLRVMRHGPGAVSRLVPGDEVHGMYNPTDRDTVEIHVYGRDLFGLAAPHVGGGRHREAAGEPEVPQLLRRPRGCRPAPANSSSAPSTPLKTHSRCSVPTDTIPSSALVSAKGASGRRSACMTLSSSTWL